MSVFLGDPTSTYFTGNTTSTDYYTYSDTPMLVEPLQITTPYVYTYPVPKKGGNDNMRYLYQVILVNPKTEAFDVMRVIAKNETSALMKAYNIGNFEGIVDFDDLKTDCRVLMEWKKEKSLEKAIKAIKEATE